MQQAPARILTWLLVVLAACVLSLLDSSIARADIVDRVLKDCTDIGLISRKYSPKQLRYVRDHLPSQEIEYGECGSNIDRALTSFRRNFSGIQTPQSPTQFTSLQKSAAKPLGPVKLNNSNVFPGASTLSSQAARNKIPPEILIVLGLIICCWLAYGGSRLTQLVRSRS